MYYIYFIQDNILTRDNQQYSSLAEASKAAVKKNIKVCRNMYFPCQEFNGIEELHKLISLYTVCMNRNGRILNKSTLSDLRTDKRKKVYDFFRKEIKAQRALLRQIELITF